MKYFLLYFCLLGMLIQCKSQDTQLLSKTRISDFSTFPFYEKITRTEGEKIVYDSQYAFINNINVDSITYLSDGLKIKGFCVTPKKEGKYPVIIFNRGGNQGFGALKLGMVITWLGELADKGYVVLCSQYRGNGGSEGKEEFGGSDVNDVLNLIDIANEIEYTNPKKIGMYGWSRGGMMTYSALVKTRKINAAVVGGAPSDMRETILDRPSMENVLHDLVPDYEKNKVVELDNRSAIKWVDKFPKDTPILMLHGNSDWRVKPEQSLNMALEFEKHRIPYRLIMFEGGDHGISEHRYEVDQQVFDWFYKYLKNDTPLPNMEYHGQ